VVNNLLPKAGFFKEVSPMRTALGVVVLLLLSCSLVPPVFPWGNTPTHPSIGASIIQDDLSTSLILPAEVIDLQRFVRANACPDIAWTQTSGGLDYIHTPEFANILRDVALSDPRYKTLNNIITAYAWGAHIAADTVGHSTYVPPSEPLHSAVEASVDTVIYYYAPARESLLKPLGFSRWEETAAAGNDCSPALVAAASARYREKVDPTARAIRAWEVWWATQSLGVAVDAEYAYIRAKGTDSSDRAFLASLGLWPFMAPYRASVEAAEAWIREK
jgi:hypothetical protein